MHAYGRLTLAALAVALSAAGCADLAGYRCTSAACEEDARIRAAVSKQIYEEPALRMFHIDVQTYQRDVYLTGLVDTRVDQSHAERIALGVPGVRRVYNGLTLDGNTW